MQRPSIPEKAGRRRLRLLLAGEALQARQLVQLFQPFLLPPSFPLVSTSSHLNRFSFSSARLRCSSSRAQAAITRNKSVVYRSHYIAESPLKKNFWSIFDIPKRRYAASLAGDRTEKKPAKECQAYAAEDGSSSVIHLSPSLGEKMDRSRSVGCGSRSFSGDFFERISNGYGDWALRRVESHREPQSKLSVRYEDSEERRTGERVKCGGIFRTLVVISPPTNRFSSGIGAGTDDDDEDFHNAERFRTRRNGGVQYVQCKSWRWSFASPMRAFWPVAGGIAGLYGGRRNKG